MSNNNKRNPPEMRFGVILNCDLDCNDCIYRNERKLDVGDCEMYKMGKPKAILSGGKCRLKKTKS